MTRRLFAPRSSAPCSRTLSRRLCAPLSALSAALLAAAHAAALPPVMDRVPEGAMLVVAIPDPTRIEKGVADLAAAIEQPLPPFSTADLLSMAGIFEGVDPAKSMALVVMPPPPADQAKSADKPADANPMGGPDVGNDAESAFDPMSDAPVYLLIPTDDYVKLLNNFGATPAPEKDAADQITLADGSAMLARNLGNGYALIARSLKDLQAYRPGKPAALKDKIGPAGDRITDSGDLVLLLDLEVAGPVLPRLREYAQQRAAEMGGLGGFGMDFDPDAVAQPDPLTQMLERDGRAMVGALKLGPLGLTIESATTFKPNSQAAQLFAAPKAEAGAAGGGAAGALAKLPAQQFFLALSADLRNAAVKQALASLETDARRNPDGRALLALLASLGKADAASFSLGASPALLAGGGVFSNAVGYLQTAQPAALADSIKTDVEALNGSTAGGMTMTTAYKVGSAKAGADPVDDITMKLAADPNNPQSSQMITGLFGPSGGPSGYLYRGKDGLIRTFAKQSILMQSAIKAASGTGPNLGGDQLLAQVGQQLPAGRIAELYIGVRPILDIGLPALMMLAGVQIDPADMPKQIPPIGMGLAAEAGAARFGAYVPAPVIKTMVLIASSIQEAQRNMMNDAPPDAADAAPEPDDQPRF